MNKPASLELRIEVNIRGQGIYNPSGGTYGDLHLSESLEIPTSGFLEMSKILGQFHDLAEKIRKERS